ncbi:MAG TPA: hypothetical protein VFW71_14725 [Actinomycetota bacterium]|nr:hypothetical protein [Actinomycetota bacterium]
MSGHETKGKIEPGAAPWEGKDTHGWAPDANKEGTEEGQEATDKSFQSNPSNQEN